MKIEVEDILGTPSLIDLMVSVDVKQHLKKTKTQTSDLRSCLKVGGGRPWLPGVLVSNSPYGRYLRT